MAQLAKASEMVLKIVSSNHGGGGVFFILNLIHKASLDIVDLSLHPLAIPISSVSYASGPSEAAMLVVSSNPGKDKFLHL